MIRHSSLPGCGRRSATVCCSTLKLRACVVQNRGAEGAMEWVLSHMEDANFNDPLSEPSQASTTGAAEAPPTAADPEAVMMLVSMGFTDQQAAAALKVSSLVMLLLVIAMFRLLGVMGVANASSSLVHAADVDCLCLYSQICLVHVLVGTQLHSGCDWIRQMRWAAKVLQIGLCCNLLLSASWCAGMPWQFGAVCRLALQPCR